MADPLHVEIRESRGTKNARRLRKSGRLPAVLYGHGKPTLSLTVPADQIEGAMRHGAKIVSLEGAEDGQALIHELDWDAVGARVLHLDLLRVQAGERIVIEVPIELRGNAAGTKDGGVVEQHMHRIEIETDIANVPEKLHVNVNGLELDVSFDTSAIEDLPEGATIVGDPGRTIAHCSIPIAAPDDEETIGGSVEPEVIGQKPSEDDPGNE